MAMQLILTFIECGAHLRGKRSCLNLPLAIFRRKANKLAFKVDHLYARCCTSDLFWGFLQQSFMLVTADY